MYVHIYRMFFYIQGCWNLINVHNIEGAHVQCMYNHYTKFKYYGSRRGVGDKPMSCKPGVAGSIPGFSQSVG